MSYLDNLYRPMNEETVVNEISAEYVADKLKKVFYKAASKRASANNAIASRNKAFSGIPAYKRDTSSPAWTVPTKHAQVSGAISDKLYKRYDKAMLKARSHFHNLGQSKQFNNALDAASAKYRK